MAHDPNRNPTSERALPGDRPRAYVEDPISSLSARPAPRRGFLAANWLWILIVLALVGIVVWGWVWDFSG